MSKVFEPKICILGGGFGGINAAIQIKKKFPDAKITLFEKGSDFGGTWFWNRYPGCECDIPSHLYSLSYETNPNWSKEFSGQEEILAYAQGVAKKHNLYNLAKFNTKVISAEWNEQSCKWRICTQPVPKTTASVDTLADIKNETSELTFEEFDYVFSAMGGLHIPKKPKFKGMEEYQGVIMHSAEWNKDVELEGKRIAVVGTGASAVQIIPQMQKIASHLTVFQRSAAWVPPKMDAPIGSISKWTYNNVPFSAKWKRLQTMAFLEFGVFPLTQKDSWMRPHVQTFFIDHIKSKVKDKALQEKLIPNYPPLSRRVTPSNGYYPALTSPNVTLEASGISHMTPSGFVAVDDTVVDVDVVILATGFDVTNNRAVDIKGVDGRPLPDCVGTPPKMYRGVCCPGLPNFFQLLGPNTGAGHFSVLFAIEAQTDYVLRLIQSKSKESGRIEVTKEATDEYNTWIQDGFKKTVWSLDTDNWYNQDGVNVALYPHSAWKLGKMYAEKPNMSHFK